MNDNDSRPLVSIIIPSWTGNIDQLEASIKRQTCQDYELVVVRGTSPAARARNIGARRSRADILVFIDDDAYFGHESVLATLVELIQQDPGIAVVGTSKLVPEQASALQQAIARQVPRMVYPVVAQHQPSNPPLRRYGFSAVTTTCCAVRRAVFEEVGGFDETLTTGPEDTDFFYRVHRQGYQILLAGNTWVYHDPPASLRDLLRKSFWYGVGHALEARKSPERGMAILPLNRWYGLLFPIAIMLGAPVALFVHYYFDPVPRIEIGFRPLKMLSSYAVLCGYVYGWYRGPQQQPARRYMGRPPAAVGGEQPATVLFVDAYPKIGGGQQVLLALASRLPGRYRPLAAVPPGSPMRERLSKAGLTAHAMAFTHYNNALPNPLAPGSVLKTAWHVAAAIRQIVRMARREQARLIHANSAVAGIHCLPAARWLGIPCVVHAHDFQTSALTNRWLGLMLQIYRRSALVCVSRALADHYGAATGGNVRSLVIENGVDTNRFSPVRAARDDLVRRWALPNDSFLIGAVGRLEAWKGFHVLLRAFAIVSHRQPQARLLIVGETGISQPGQTESELMDLVRELGIDDKVVFAGFVDDMPAVMASIDLLVHTPTEPEAFGLILIEAMASGCPVVSVPVGGITDIVIHEYNGLLAPPGDVQGIAAAVLRLLDDPALAHRLGQAGRRTADRNFTIEKQVSELVGLYDALLGEQAHSRTAAATADYALGTGQTGRE